MKLRKRRVLHDPARGARNGLTRVRGSSQAECTSTTRFAEYPFHIGSTAFGLLEAGHGKKRDGGTDETSNKRQKMSGSEVDAIVAVICCQDHLKRIRIVGQQWSRQRCY